MQMPDTARIRDLNDRFRATMTGGKIVMTNTIAARSDLPQIIEKVRRFDAFDADNNPWGENDFGAFEAERDTIFWKIDYYDRALAAGSPDPADVSLTLRVLTIMLAEEY
jgi:hypothetical protein